MMMFLPSTYPISRKPCRRASSRDAFKDAELETSTPMRQTCADSCAATGKLSAKSMAPSTRMNFGFLILDFRLLDEGSLCRLPNVLLIFLSFFSSNPKSKIGNLKSFDHLVRPRQHVRRNLLADLLFRLQIDDQLKLHWVLDRKFGGLGAF